MQINKYKNLGSGWHNDSVRHSNAKIYGSAGGLYAGQNKELKKGLYANSRQFKINDKISIVCRYGDSRDGFNHFATLYVNGVEVDQVKIHYINRTWESYEFESVLNKLVDKTKNLSDSEKEVARKFIKNPQRTEDDMADLRTVGAIAQLGEIFGNTQKEKNDWKVRMIKAGLGDKGLDMPEDWDRLSEDEKERRLNLVTEQLTKKEKKGLYAKLESGFSVYDNGGETADRYTIVVGKEVYAMSDNPLSPQGVNQYVGRIGKNFTEKTAKMGKKISTKNLPEEVQKAIMQKSEW